MISQLIPLKSRLSGLLVPPGLSPRLNLFIIYSFPEIIYGISINYFLITIRAVFYFLSFCISIKIVFSLKIEFFYFGFRWLSAWHTSSTILYYFFNAHFYWLFHIRAEVCKFRLKLLRYSTFYLMDFTGS